MRKQTYVILPTKTAPTPLAQNTKVLHQSSSAAAAIDNCLNSINKSCYFQGLAGAVATLLFHSGVRISELLNVRSCDVSFSGLVYIKSLKGSNDRYIQITSHQLEWQSFRTSGRKIGDYYSRFYFYRHFKTIGISFNFGENSKASVTHAARHFKILEMQALNPSTDAIKSTMGHKSPKSTESYFGIPCYIDEDGNRVAKNYVTHNSPRTTIKQGIRSPLAKNQLNNISGFAKYMNKG